MKEGILIGRKSDGKGKPLTDVIPFDEARRKLAAHRNDSKEFGKDIELVELWKPVGVKSVVKSVVEAREKKNAQLAEDEASKPVKKPGKAAAFVAGLILLSAIGLHAQGFTTVQLGATAITATSTNTAESASYNWAADDIMVMQATCTAADAGTSNVVFYLDSSLDGLNWQADTLSATFACNGSNVANTVITRVTNSTGGLKWRIGGVGTDQTNTVTLSAVRYYIKGAQ